MTEVLKFNFIPGPRGRNIGAFYQADYRKGVGMNIRDAIYKAEVCGKIRLKEKVFEIPTLSGSICLLGDEKGYIFTVAELTSLDWEAQSTEWIQHKDD